ncbi:hypothetical protein KEM55_007123 [Ascosphaera atra]|nr:hypothetical protein KEM55_007123 [Ascosphaera atra]
MERELAEDIDQLQQQQDEGDNEEEGDSDKEKNGHKGQDGGEEQVSTDKKEGSDRDEDTDKEDDTDEEEGDSSEGSSEYEDGRPRTETRKSVDKHNKYKNTEDQQQPHDAPAAQLQEDLRDTSDPQEVQPPVAESAYATSSQALQAAAETAW